MHKWVGVGMYCKSLNKVDIRLKKQERNCG
jgi:hypothetical protein